jgi:hypothetical protein
MGNLQLAVLGAEAKVFLDGEFKGLAQPDQPLNLTGLLPGEAKLSVESPGHLTVKRTLQIEPGKWTQVALPMKKGVVLLVYRKPNFAQWVGTKFEVLIDDRKMAELGDKDFVRIEIPAGTWTLKVLQVGKDAILAKLQAKIQVENSPNSARFFRINAGFSLVLSEQSEDTWKSESVRFGSRAVEVLK